MGGLHSSRATWFDGVCHVTTGVPAFSQSENPLVDMVEMPPDAATFGILLSDSLTGERVPHWLSFEPSVLKELLIVSYRIRTLATARHDTSWLISRFSEEPVPHWLIFESSV